MESVQTREGLVNGLWQAYDLMSKILNKQNEVSAFYQANPLMPYKEHKALKGKKRTIIITTLICWFFIYGSLIMPQDMLAENGKAGIHAVFVLILNIVVCVLLVKRLKKKLEKYNKNIDAENETIKKLNDQKQVQLNNQIQPVKDQIIEYQKIYASDVAPWYPPDYCTLEAADYFYNAVKNYRANTLGEAINLYETYLHQQRMESSQQAMLENQQKMIKQQKLNNILQVGQIAMQAATFGAIKENTQATINAGNQISDTVYESVTGRTSPRKIAEDVRKW